MLRCSSVPPCEPLENRRLLAATLPDKTDALSRRIAWRTLMDIARAAHDPKTTPGVAALLDQRLHEEALALAQRTGDAAERAWGASLSRLLLDPRELDKELVRHARATPVPPGSRPWTSIIVLP